MTICLCSPDTFTGFDDIRFGILADEQSGVYTDWGGIEPIYAEEQVPFSNIVVRELIGFSPAIVTWRLQIACRHQYYALLSRLGTTGTLTVLAGYQSLRGTQITRGNPAKVYEALDQVLLRAMPVRELHPDGYTEVEAVWQRSVDPVTRLAEVLP